jgi:DnaJ-domain-containing protein 1
VAVYFELDGEEVCFACDRWYYVEENVRAIGKTLEALRGINRWGTDDMVRASFQGFAALPAEAGRAWWEVLGIRRGASRAEIDAAYRQQLKRHHPDLGGDREMFLALQEAYEQATGGVLIR